MTTPPAPARHASSRFFYGWIMLGIAFLGMFASGAGQSFTVSVFVGPILDEFGITRTSISTAYMAGTLTAAFGLSYVGMLIDRYGIRRMMVAVAFLLGGAAMLFSTIGNIMALYVGFTAIRIFGQGSMMLISTNLASQWFVRRRGLALSLVNLGFAFSTAMYPPVIQWLILQGGWRSAWLWIGGFTWLLIIPAAALLVRNRPEDVGLLPDGAASEGEQRFGPGTQSEQPDAAASLEQSWPVRAALRTPQFWIMGVAMSVPSMLITGMIFHQISYFQEQGLGAQTAANVFTVTAISMVICGLLFGQLFDRFPARYVVSLGLLAMGAAMLVMRLADTTLMAAVYALVLGMAQGAMMTMSSYVWPSYFGRKYLGGIQGVATTIIIIGASLGPMPFGLAFDLLGGYRGALLGLSVLPLATAIVVAFTRPPVHQPNLKTAPAPAD